MENHIIQPLAHRGRNVKKKTVLAIIQSRLLFLLIQMLVVKCPYKSKLDEFVETFFEKTFLSTISTTSEPNVLFIGSVKVDRL